jgi:hypothetical protein
VLTEKKNLSRFWTQGRVLASPTVYQGTGHGRYSAQH